MKVLLTGSTGYIGRRLKKRLLQDHDVDLRLLVRDKRKLSSFALENSEVVEGDTFDIDKLRIALRDVDVAYYLIHSLNSKDYKDLDKKSAQNFIDIAQECGVKKIIYLGGLGIKDENTSEHLLSRIETGEILSSSDTVQTIWIRAGVIIGSGSTSFEIIRNLVEKLPIMTTPTWVSTKAQPIAIEDVLRYLYGSLKLKKEENIIIDIGSEQLTYKEMMKQTAQVLRLKRYLIPVPFLSINLSSYWLNIFTPIPFSVAKSLIKGLKSEVIIQNDNAKKYFPMITPIPYKRAVLKAKNEIESHQVVSRWCDSDGKVWDGKTHIEDAVYVDRKSVTFNCSSRKIFEKFTKLGGENGWLGYQFLWNLRGLIDKLIGGVGSKRGRRDPKELRIGDSVDFWKVIDVQEDERLLLRAQMKLPGTAWLEFKIKDNTLIQSAYFYPRGVLGRAYWYVMIPFHYFIFTNMINGILKNTD